MSENLNATCAICGTKYHMCETCKNIRSFQPWRTVADTLSHYMIYLVLSEYTKTGNKEKAREELLECDLTGLESFDKDIKKVIKELLKEEKTTKVELEKEKSSIKFSGKRNQVKIKEEKENDIE